MFPRYLLPPLEGMNGHSLNMHAHSMPKTQIGMNYTGMAMEKAFINILIGTGVPQHNHCKRNSRTNYFEIKVFCIVLPFLEVTSYKP